MEYNQEPFLVEWNIVTVHTVSCTCCTASGQGVNSNGTSTTPGKQLEKLLILVIISKESIRFSVIKKSRYIHCSEFDSFLLYQIAINFLIISL